MSRWTERARDPRSRRVLAAAVFLVVALVAARIASYRMFTGFGVADDEGYFLISIQGFIVHGGLYDSVFSQYGPFYFDLWGGLFSTLGIAVTHDAGRYAVSTIWVLSGLVGGIVAYRMTGSIVIGAFAEVLVFHLLRANAADPMHPGSLASLILLLLAGAACLLLPGRPRLAMAALGIGISALLLTKVNLGVFALLSTALVCVATYPALARRASLRLVAEVAFVSAPFILMRQDLAQSWAQHFSLTVAISALAFVVALRGLGPDRSRRAAELRWLASAFVGATVLFCIPPLLTGTGPGGLVDGAVLTPFLQNSGLTIPYLMPNGVLGAELAMLGACIGYRLLDARGALHGSAWTLVRPVISIGTGVLMALLATEAWLPLPGFAPDLWPLGLVWVALIPAGDENPDDLGFARRWLPALGLLQGLHAYPVAATQVAYGAVLLVPTAAICVANGVRDLRLLAPSDSLRRVRRVAVPVVAIVTGLVLVNAFLRSELDHARDAYAHAVPLDLPGAERVHVDGSEAAALDQVSRLLADRCSTFVSLPGLNSFYLWARLDPPTWQNAGHWWNLLDRDAQRQVVGRSLRIHRLCVLRNPVYTHILAGRLPTDGDPLLAFIREGFRPDATVGSDQIMFRRSLHRRGRNG
jgi:hypothetical protein